MGRSECERETKSLTASVTRFGENLLLWQKIKSLGNFGYGLFSIRQTFAPTLTVFMLLRKFSLASKWPKIEKI